MAIEAVIAVVKEVAVKTVEATVQVAEKTSEVVGTLEQAIEKLPEQVGRATEAEQLPNELTEVFEPNTSFEIDGVIYETNDAGIVYKIDGELVEVVDLEELLNAYFQDLKNYSECSETILDKPFDVSDLKKRTPEENAEMREEFNDNKAQLKREWEEINHRPWPKYKEDVYSANGNLIRKAGSDYDAHHIQPLGMGGKNEASNITPLSAEVHYDKQGIHASGSPYSKLDQALGGM